jgi:pantoate--beta-alanine ligase
MKIARRRGEVRTALEEARRSGRSIGFVPTMGALHDGHLSLVRAARAGCDVVVLSVFVNPLQFGPEEDFDVYPRAESRDLALLEAEGVDLAFAPEVEEMYPHEASTTVSVGRVSESFEGAHRPGHFDGVATVCAKLFNIVAPDRAYFGQKDAQQVAVLKRMVRDLDLTLEIVVCPTVRAPDGLALSSRNAYLSTEDRGRATALYRALQAGATDAAAADFEGAERTMRAVLEGIEVDYAGCVDPDTFGAPRRGAPVLLVVAAYIGSTRLIDNLMVEPAGAPG